MSLKPTPAPEAWSATIEAYLAHESAFKPQTTIKLRAYHLRRFAHLAGGEPAGVAEQLIIDHLTNPAWSPNYRRSVLATLRSFFTWARRTGITRIDPTIDLPAIRARQTFPRPASAGSIQAGLSRADSRTRLMIRFANEAGLRCCEISKIHSKDLLGTPGQYGLRVHGKGGRERIVPILDDLAVELTKDGWQFPGQIDGHLSAAYVSKLISRALGDSGTAHPLRHLAATEWLRSSGGNLRVVQELLGHASVATTQIYTLIDDDDKRQAVVRRAA